MSQQSALSPRSPSPIFGILAPGEKRTRKFGVLPRGVMPLLQNFPNGTVRLVEQSSTHVTVENTGMGKAPFSILFVTQAQVEKLMLIKNTLDGVARLRKKS